MLTELEITRALWRKSYYRHRAKRLIRAKEYREAHKEECNRVSREWYYAHKEECAKKGRVYRAVNRERLLKKWRAYYWRRKGEKAREKAESNLERV